jgi:hypothetical protein
VKLTSERWISAIEFTATLSGQQEKPMFEKERPLAATVLAVLLLGGTYFGVWFVNQDAPLRTALPVTPCEATK